jgi:hypothetical protein
MSNVDGGADVPATARIAAKTTEVAYGRFISTDSLPGDGGGTGLGGLEPNVSKTHPTFR